MTETGNEISYSDNEVVNRNVLQVDDDCFKDSSHEIGRENGSALNDVMCGEDGEIVPKIGMKFKDDNEVYEFYKSYAYRLGFPIRKRNLKKGGDGVVRYVTFTYSQKGRRINTTSTSLKPQPTIQTGCKARMTTCLEVCGTWRINTVHLEHNHKISPSKSRLYRCNRELSAQIKRKLEVSDIAGTPLHKSYNSIFDIKR
ncbi:Protein FAR1-RELATED SEQUENCE [Abeliophyllum distichum]|uniref:Protein FAR1-RELATED SEQUENCE n=1 Tax=Abeliophyllum distichum TaxID=126358 RepID=A0ABD1T082_9LAMI